MENNVDDQMEEETESDGALPMSRQRLLVGAVLVLLFCVLCTDTFLYPFFPSEAKKKELSGTQIGVVYSAYELAKFVASPIVGLLMDKTQPKLICIIGGAGSGVASVSFGFLAMVPNDWFLGLCIALRFIAGAASAALTVAATTILLKATSYHNTTIIAAIEMMQGCGYIIGPAIGTGLFELGGYTLSFDVLGGATILFSVFLIWIMPTVAAEKAYETANKNFLGLFRIGGITLVFVHCLVTKIATSSTQTTISDWIVTRYDKPLYTVGLLFGLWALIYIACCPIISHLVNKGFVYTTLLTCWSVTTTCYLLFGPSSLLDFIFHGQKYFWVMVVAMGVNNITKPGLYIIPFQAIIDLAKTEGYNGKSMQTIGMITGLINSAFGLGAMFGPIIAGAITQMSDFGWTTTALAFMNLTMLSALAVYLTFMKIVGKSLRPAEEETTPFIS